MSLWNNSESNTLLLYFTLKFFCQYFHVLLIETSQISCTSVLGTVIELNALHKV